MSKQKLTPIGANILVRPISEDKTSASGIVLPETVDKEKPQKGEVIALGSGSVKGKKIEFNVKVGDMVIFKKYSPDEIELDDETLLVMDEEAILAILS